MGEKVIPPYTHFIKLIPSKLTSAAQGFQIGLIYSFVCKSSYLRLALHLFILLNKYREEWIKAYSIFLLERHK